MSETTNLPRKQHFLLKIKAVQGCRRCNLLQFVAKIRCEFVLRPSTVAFCIPLCWGCIFPLHSICGYCYCILLYKLVPFELVNVLRVSRKWCVTLYDIEIRNCKRCFVKYQVWCKENTYLTENAALIRNVRERQRRDILCHGLQLVKTVLCNFYCNPHKSD